MRLHFFPVTPPRATGQSKPNWAVKRSVPGSGCPSVILLEGMVLYSTTGDEWQKKAKTILLPVSTRWELRTVSALLSQKTSMCPLLKSTFALRPVSLNRQYRYLCTRSRNTSCISMMTVGLKQRRTICLTYANALTCAL